MKLGAAYNHIILVDIVSWCWLCACVKVNVILSMKFTQVRGENRTLGFQV